jgi:hypothetical protein
VLRCGGLAALSGVAGPSKTVGVQSYALNTSTNADGDPAADGMKVLLTVGRCNVEHAQCKLQSAFKGVDLESESQ